MFHFMLLLPTDLSSYSGWFNPRGNPPPPLWANCDNFTLAEKDNSAALSCYSCIKTCKKSQALLEHCWLCLDNISCKYIWIRWHKNILVKLITRLNKQSILAHLIIMSWPFQKMLENSECMLYVKLITKTTCSNIHDLFFFWLITYTLHRQVWYSTILTLYCYILFYIPPLPEIITPFQITSCSQSFCGATTIANEREASACHMWCLWLPF